MFIPYILLLDADFINLFFYFLFSKYSNIYRNQILLNLFSSEKIIYLHHSLLTYFLTKFNFFCSLRLLIKDFFFKKYDLENHFYAGFFFDNVQDEFIS